MAIFNSYVSLPEGNHSALDTPGRTPSASLFQLPTSLRLTKSRGRLAKIMVIKQKVFFGSTVGEVGATTTPTTKICY